MFIIKSAKQQLQEYLEKHLAETNREINHNAWQIKNAVEAQTIRKRKRAEICKLINALKN